MTRILNEERREEVGGETDSKRERVRERERKKMRNNEFGTH